MATQIRGNVAGGLDSRLVCELLGHSVERGRGRLILADAAAAEPGVATAVRFLVEQGWLSEDGAGWCATAAGRFWFERLDHRDIVKSHDYGGALFLVHVVANATETVVWHKGRFATIGIAYIPHPEHFEIRRENEPVTTSGGVQMEDALATACALLTEKLEVPEPPQPEELRLHMLNYLERL